MTAVRVCCGVIAELNTIWCPGHFWLIFLIEPI